MSGSADTLVVITGPTGSGKTALAIEVAEALGCEIVSADSRQVYRGMSIGTAAPTAAEQARVRHHLVGFLDPREYYSAACFAADVEGLLPELFRRGGGYAVMCGGSQMYVDAVTLGLDELPRVTDANRERAWSVYRSGGLEALQAALREHDPAYLAQCADPCNHRRLIHALEVSWEAGRPYSSLLGGGARRRRSWRVVKYAIDRPRPELYERINARVASMLEAGLLGEVRALAGHRHCNALNTVGYKEMLAHLDGLLTLDEAAARMARNTRVYAKKQLTWLRRGLPEDIAELPLQAAAVVEHLQGEPPESGLRVDAWLRPI